MSREDDNRHDALLEKIRELEKSIAKRERISTPDIILWCLAGVMAVGLYLAPYKTPLSVCVGLICMVLFATHPTLHLSWITGADSTHKKITYSLVAMLGMILLVGFYGWYVWPSIKRHTLTARERASFENALKSQKGDDLEVQIACPSDDEKTCTYAEQFINLVGKSGWKVESYITRLTLARARDGITVYRRGGNKDYLLKHWDAGGYFAINEPHLLAVQSAFQSIHIEIEGGTNPDIPENVMTIYFGPERENEAEPTYLTRSTEWATGKRKGPFPVSQQ